MSENTIRIGAATWLEQLAKDPANIGPWLALNDKNGSYEVVARGEDGEEVYRIAVEKGVELPFIMKVPVPGVRLFF